MKSVARAERISGASAPDTSRHHDPVAAQYGVPGPKSMYERASNTGSRGPALFPTSSVGTKDRSVSTGSPCPNETDILLQDCARSSNSSTNNPTRIGKGNRHVLFFDDFTVEGPTIITGV